MLFIIFFYLFIFVSVKVNVLWISSLLFGSVATPANLQYINFLSVQLYRAILEKVA